MTQSTYQDEARLKHRITSRIAENEKELKAEIKKVRQLTLKKFLVYFCLNAEPMDVTSRRAKYDYKLAKEIILQHLKNVDDILYLNSRLEEKRLEQDAIVPSTDKK